jgi:hypothetical protein
MTMIIWFFVGPLMTSVMCSESGDEGSYRIPKVCEWCNEAWPTHCSQCCHLCAEQTCDEYCEEFPLLCDLCDYDRIYENCLWNHCYDREIRWDAIVDAIVWGAIVWGATVPHCTPGDGCWDCCWDWGRRRCWISCEDPQSAACYRCVNRLAQVCFTNKCGDPGILP